MTYYERILLGLSIALAAYQPGFPAAIVCVSLASIVGLKAWLDHKRTSETSSLRAEIDEIKERVNSLALRGMR